MKIDYQSLKSTCLSPIESFKGLGDVVETPDGIYIYKDNGAKVLGIAHLDTVLGLEHFYRVNVNGDSIVLNAQLDDRLGAYALIHLLPSLGIEFDLLLTEGEETGHSTAAYFETSKDYNWMFSFDRHGDDVVLYQYESKVINDALKSSKFRIGKGSFSDIAFLDHLGCKGFNVGTGYEGEHTDMSYANMTTFKAQVNRFIKFHSQNKDTKYPHEQKTISKITVNDHYSMKDSYYDYSARRIWGEYDNLYCYLCRAKRGTERINESVWLCSACMGHAAQCQDCADIFYEEEIISDLCVDCLDWRETKGRLNIDE